MFAGSRNFDPQRITEWAFRLSCHLDARIGPSEMPLL